MNMTRTLMVGAALVPALLGMSPQERGAAQGPSRELWVFLSTGEKDLETDLREILRWRREGVRFTVRPCLLVDDFRGLTMATRGMVETVKALRDLVGDGFSLPIVDEEGLALARALGIERLPAWVWVDRHSRRAHLVYGRGARLSEVISCE